MADLKQMQGELRTALFLDTAKLQPVVSRLARVNAADLEQLSKQELLKTIRMLECTLRGTDPLCKISAAKALARYLPVVELKPGSEVDNRLLKSVLNALWLARFHSNRKVRASAVSAYQEIVGGADTLPLAFQDTVPVHSPVDLVDLLAEPLVRDAASPQESGVDAAVGQSLLEDEEFIAAVGDSADAIAEGRRPSLKQSKAIGKLAESIASLTWHSFLLLLRALRVQNAGQLERKTSLPTARELEAEIAAAQAPIVVKLNAWLQSLEGTKVPCSRAEEQVNDIKYLVARSGCELLYERQVVTLYAHTPADHDHAVIHVNVLGPSPRSRRPYARVAFPKVTARPVDFP